MIKAHPPRQTCPRKIGNETEFENLFQYYSRNLFSGMKEGRGLFSPALQRIQSGFSRFCSPTRALKTGRCALQLFLR